VNREEELLAETYTAYNTQDVDALLALVTDDALAYCGRLCPLNNHWPCNRARDTAALN